MSKKNHFEYRKLPVTIEAFQMTKARRKDNHDWPQWLHKAWQDNWGEANAVGCEDYPNSDSTDRLVIWTLEGIMTVEWNDYIIKGVHNELYPCKPEIFELTHEKVVSNE